MRNNFLKVLLLIIFTALFSSIKNAQTLPERPNIVLFIADDAGMDFGCYGNEFIKTPNIDQLAKEGLICSNAFLTTPQCSPSRTSMLSGQFAHTIGSEDLHHPMNEGTKLLPHYLKEEGYYTGLLMKKHLGDVNGNEGTRQFDHIGEGRDDKAQELFREFLDKTDNRPFFAWVAFYDPHRPYGDKNGAEKVHNHDSVVVPPYLINSVETRKDIALYYDEINRMDTNIGAMLKELEKRNLRDNTLVVFLSDNGMPFPRCKGTLYDYGIKTPLIFHWKNKVMQNVNYDELVSTIDLAPTILEIAGIRKPKEMYGESLSEIFSDQSVKGREYVFSERNWHDTDAHMRSVRSDKYKFIVNGYPELLYPIIGDYYGAGSWVDLLNAADKNMLNKFQNLLFEFPRFKVELYDLENDPFEVNNLIMNNEYKAVASKLSSVLSDWEVQTNDYPSYKKRRGDVIDRRSGFFFDRDSAFDYEKFGYWDD